MSLPASPLPPARPLPPPPLIFLALSFRLGFGLLVIFCFALNGNKPAHGPLDPVFIVSLHERRRRRRCPSFLLSAGCLALPGGLLCLSGDTQRHPQIGDWPTKPRMNGSHHPGKAGMSRTGELAGRSPQGEGLSTTWSWVLRVGVCHHAPTPRGVSGVFPWPPQPVGPGSGDIG